MKIISGGQCGADIGGLRAAKEFGIKTGGWIPKGFLTEAGPRPSLGKDYGLVETPSSEYPPRTYLNVRDSDITLWFGDANSRGGRLTQKSCRMLNRPFHAVGSVREDIIAALMCGHATINIAGNRESNHPGIEKVVYMKMCLAFGRLRRWGEIL